MFLRIYQHHFVWLTSSRNQLPQHFHISHDKPCLRPKRLEKYCFQFLLGRLYQSQEKLKTMLEANKVYYGRCESGEFLRNILATDCDWQMSLTFIGYIFLIANRTMWWRRDDAFISQLTNKKLHSNQGKDTQEKQCEYQHIG